MYGRIVNTFIFPMGGAAAWHDEDGKVPGYRKIRSLLPNMMIRNSSIYAMKSVPDRTTKNKDCCKDYEFQKYKLIIYISFVNYNKIVKDYDIAACWTCQTTAASAVM